VRIISHSLYAGLGGFVGLMVVSTLIPGVSISALGIIVMGALVGGALFAQWVEGSSRLLRPFGYFGTIIGVAIALGVISVLRLTDSWLLCAGFAVAAPAVQALGRLRCLVQGCCHGRASAKATQGIKCWHPSSRVTHLSGMANVPIYPTPLYSIGWNLFIGVILLRLWSLAVPANLVTGLYFILVGLGRFVEEAYRGEPQTPVKAGLRLYHWYSVASVIAGIVVSCIPSPITGGSIAWEPGRLPVALVCGVLSGAAMGVDFPASHKRFARLSG
jgi:hypothetical protein